MITLSRAEIEAAVRAWLVEQHDLDLPESVLLKFKAYQETSGSLNVTITIDVATDHFSQGPYR